jgi:hypothetical protein
MYRFRALDLGTRYRGGLWSLPSREKKPLYHLDGRLGGPQFQYQLCGEETNPTRSPALYRLSCPSTSMCVCVWGGGASSSGSGYFRFSGGL